jgi:hypothetical protein
VSPDPHYAEPKDFGGNATTNVMAIVRLVPPVFESSSARQWRRRYRLELPGIALCRQH